MRWPCSGRPVRRRQLQQRRRRPARAFAASFSLAATPGAAPPASGTATGTVLVNGSPFTSGTIPYGATVDATTGTVLLGTDTGSVQAVRRRCRGGFVLVRGTDNKK